MAGGLSMVFKKIFSPHDGTRVRVKAVVDQSHERLNQASNRLEETIRDLLHENDRLKREDRYAREST